MRTECGVHDEPEGRVVGECSLLGDDDFVAEVLSAAAVFGGQA